MIDYSDLITQRLDSAWSTCQQGRFQTLFLHGSSGQQNLTQHFKSLVQHSCHQYGVGSFLFELQPDQNLSPYSPFLDLLRLLSPEPALLEKKLSEMDLHIRYKNLIKAYLLQYPLALTESPLRESIDFDVQAIRAAILELLVLFLPDTPSIIAIARLQFAGTASWHLIREISEKLNAKPILFICSFERNYRNVHPMLEDNWGPFLNWLEDTHQTLTLPNNILEHALLQQEIDAMNWDWHCPEPLNNRSKCELVSGCQALLNFLCLDEAVAACRICEPYIELSGKDHHYSMSQERSDFKRCFGQVLYFLGDFDGALFHFDRLLEEAQLEHNNGNMARACRGLSWIHAGKSELETALHYANQSIRFSELTQNSLDQVLARFVHFYVINRTTETIDPDAFNLLIINLEKFSQYDALIFCLRNFYLTLRFFDNMTLQQAFAASNRAIKLARKYADVAAVAAAYQSKGILYSYKLDYIKTLRCLRVSESLRAKVGEPIEMVRIWNGIGYFYTLLEDVPSAMRYFRNAFSILHKVKDFSEASVSLYNLAWLYFICSHYDAVTDALDKILQLSRIRKVTHFPFRTLHDIYALKGICHLKMGNVIRAQHYLDEFQQLQFTTSKTGVFLGMLLQALVQEQLQQFAAANASFMQIPPLISRNLDADQRLMPLYYREYAGFLARTKQFTHLPRTIEAGLALTQTFKMPVTYKVFEHYLQDPLCEPQSLPLDILPLEMEAFIETSRMEVQLERLHRRVRDIRIISTLQGMGARFEQIEPLAAETMRLLSTYFCAQFGYIHLKVNGKLSLEPLASFGDTTLNRTAYELAAQYLSIKDAVMVQDVQLPDHLEQSALCVRSIISIPLTVGSICMGNILIGTLAPEPDLNREDFELMEVVANNLAQQLHSCQQKLRLLAISSTDTLTGLANRQAFQQKIENELKRDQRYSHNFTLAFIDLDNFKFYNDQFGHDVGDKILIEFSQLLVTCLRSVDIPARWGGDEFIILFPETGEKDAFIIANRIVELVGSPGSYAHQLITELRHSSNGKTLGCSIGLAEFSPDTKPLSISALLKVADTALYKAKELGKGRVQIGQI